MLDPSKLSSKLTRMGAGQHHPPPGNERRLAIAAALTGLFMLAELAGGIVSGSLALIADAGHMLADFASLGLAWGALRLARRPADWRRTYGFDRFSVLVAFANGLTLFLVAAWIVVEAIERLRNPPDVLGGLMLAVAAGGLAVNIVAFLILRGAGGSNLNIRAALLHVAGDLLGSVAAIAASLVILATGWTPIDPLLSVLVALIILRSGWHVVSESAHILLEGSPVDVRELRHDLRTVEGVAEVHHVHAWSITQERPVVTLHARLAPNAPPDVLARLKARLYERFGVAHATIELETGDCPDARCATAQHAVPDRAA